MTGRAPGLEDKISTGSFTYQTDAQIKDREELVKIYSERPENDKNIVNHGMTFVVALIGAVIVFRVINVLAF